MLQNWTNFFLTTAAVGTQLIGLLFVVVTIGSSLLNSQSVAGIRAFLTPTLTCFSGVLLQALVVLVPLAIRLAKGSHAGPERLGEPCLSPLRNPFSAQARFRRAQRCRLDRHNAFPVIADASLICGGAGLIAEIPFAAYAIAGATTLLLISGIYGAWDLTLWMVTNRDKT